MPEKSLKIVITISKLGLGFSFSRKCLYKGTGDIFRGGNFMRIGFASLLKMKHLPVVSSHLN